VLAKREHTVYTRDPMKKSLGPKPILYPHPVVLVGTYNAQGKPNIMTVSWTGICCSRPPCVSVALRKATYTYGNLVLQRAFTVSIPAVTHLRQADYAGIASGRDVDKFAKTGLTPVAADHVHAPYVSQCPVVLECELVHTLEIGSHTIFVGKILDVKADTEVLDTDGDPDLARVRPFAWASGNNAYFAMGERLQEAFTVTEL
jgi:flavin reductase (DIM6/NTAB) family NADH-FMN oxidoreductase RutF